MQLFIITGTSKGLGLSLAQKALTDGHKVLSIGRSASINHPNHFFLQHDLVKAEQLEENFLKSISNFKSDSFTAIHLINNAAVVSPIGHAEDFSWSDISSHMHVNLLLPVFLCSLFIKSTKGWNGAKIITQISSGAALRPIEGWSMYCASKSGLKMFSDCLNAENPGVKTVNINPGVMDTGMQAILRDQNSENFSRVQEFRQLKEKNQLAPTDKVASAIVNFLCTPEKINKTWYEINELYS